MISLRSSDFILISFLMVLPEILVTSQAHTKETASMLGASQLLAPAEAAQNMLQRHGGALSSSEESDFLTALAPFASPDMYGENVESDIRFHDSSRGASEESAQLPDKAIVETSGTGSGYRIGPGNSSIEEMPKFKSVEYEARPAGTLLDEFDTGKLSAAEAANALPIFLTEPESMFGVKNRPAVLKCKAAHALQLHFKCSGSSQPPPSTHDKHVDPHTGVHLEEVTATIHRDLVDEYFGKGPFKCECHAWSSRGVLKSQAATINIAYMRKQFTTSPTSLRVEVGSRAELYCEPPSGFPEPKLLWHKNNMPVAATAERGPTVSSAGTLVFQQVTLQDMANYTCSAENIAGKRISESAVLIVYVNGGWSSWSPWRECKCASKPSQGRKRTRTCTNPIPMNGGAQCSGPQIQKSQDCIPCPEDTQIINADGFDISTSKRSGRWSAWSEWSPCSSDCIQIRRRKCITNAADDGVGGGSGMVGGGSLVSIPGAASILGISSANSGGNGASGGGVNVGSGGVVGGGLIGAGSGVVGYGKSQCSGKDIQTAECRGELCHIGKDDFDWTLYLGLAFITAVCFAFCAALICCARRGIGANPHYNMARTVMDSEYLPGADKKEMRMHIEAVSYDYANPGHRYLPNDHHIVGCNMSEHHYDVPNLAANYTNPIDELSVDYRTDTPDTSTADTSNSTYDITVKLSTPSVAKNTTSELLSSSGGALRLYGGDIMLYIPELAIGKHLKKHATLMLLGDDSTRISIIPSIDSLLTCSSVVYSAPRNYSFQKPVILKIPHCLVEPELWNVNIFQADNEHDDLNVSWRRVLTVGEETINTPVFVQLENTHVYIMTEQLGRFVVAADPKGCTNFAQPSIKMKLIAFSQLTPSSSNCSLRIYVVKDFPNSKDICSGIESQLGGSYMGESEAFAFQLNNQSLSIRVHLNDADVWETPGVDLHEQVIPYQHILSSNNILHCEFSIRRSGGQLANAPLALEVEFAQLNTDAIVIDEEACEWHSFAVPSERRLTPPVTLDRQTATTVSIDRQGNYVNDTNLLGSIQLPRVTKRLICAALDPPRADERDWRLLAHKLNSDRYIAYFATKPSPTEQILNLWECRASQTANTILELLLTLKDMERPDVMDIITETIGPLWI